MKRKNDLIQALGREKNKFVSLIKMLLNHSGPLWPSHFKCFVVIIVRFIGLLILPKLKYKHMLDKNCFAYKTKLGIIVKYGQNGNYNFYHSIGMIV